MTITLSLLALVGLSAAQDFDLNKELKAIGLSEGEYTVTARMLVSGFQEGTAVGTATVSRELKDSALMVKYRYRWPDRTTAEDLFIVSYDKLAKEYVLTSFIGPSANVRIYRGQIATGLVSSGTTNARLTFKTGEGGTVTQLAELEASSGWQGTVERVFKPVAQVRTPSG